MTTTGQVYLIGAGPGAADLLTLRAARVLAAVDVVLVDDLVDRGILAHVRADARVIPVGKRGGGHATPQPFIQRLMLRYARQGKTVGRLKGGDPLVFGRGGEEAEFLEGHGVTVEVVPGLTAGIAVPASIGIPVTRRGVSRGVTFVTAHGDDHGEPDWGALARSGTTLVIYMGLSRLASIGAGLAAGGLAATTPAAVISHGTLPTQRQVIGCLATIADLARDARIEAPALIVVGEVVNSARSGQQDLLPALQRQAA